MEFRRDSRQSHSPKRCRDFLQMLSLEINDRSHWRSNEPLPKLPLRKSLMNKHGFTRLIRSSREKSNLSSCRILGVVEIHHVLYVNGRLGTNERPLTARRPYQMDRSR